MGERADRDVKQAEGAGPGGRTFWICLIAGWAVIAYGIGGLLLNADRTHPEQWIRWVVGALVVHDLIVAPLVFALGAYLVARIPPGARAATQGALFASGVVVLTAWPFLRGYGLLADNPSALPNNYALGLAIVLSLVWAATAVLLTWTWRRNRSG